MEATEFEEVNCIMGKGQPQYLPLPLHRAKDDSGTLTFCWQLSWRERWKVLFTGKVWHQVLTFNNFLQPQRLLADKPELPKP